MEPHYEGTAAVKKLLAGLTIAQLEQVYAECLTELKNGGPGDGDVSRSAFGRRLIEAELDRRMPSLEVQRYWRTGDRKS